MPEKLVDPQSFLPLTNIGFHTLVALAEEDRHGYAIIKDIEDRTGGGLSVRSGALYTAIQRLLEDGMVDHAGDPAGEGGSDQRRKYYRITPLGRDVAALEGLRLAEMLDGARRRRLVPDREVG